MTHVAESWHAGGMRRVAAVVLVVLVACSSSGGTSAREAAVAGVETTLKGQWGRAYDLLLIQQQAIITKDAYVECFSAKPHTVPDDLSIKATDDYPERTKIPGTDVEVDTTAVTIEISGGGQKLSQTMHLVKVDGVWRFGLSQEQIDQVKAGDCS